MRMNDDDCCDICFSPDAEDEDIIYCDSCGQCYHPSCAHLPKSVIFDQTHICAFCKADKPTCMLCQCNTPFHMFKLFDGYVHTICFRMSPFPYDFDNPEQSVKKQISKNQFLQQCMSDAKCQHCTQKGLIIDCTQKGCRHFYHPSCFISENGAVIIKENNDFQILSLCCSEHKQATVQVKKSLMYMPVMHFLNNQSKIQNYKQQLTSTHRPLGSVISIIGKPQAKNNDKYELYEKTDIINDYKLHGNNFVNFREISPYMEQVITLERIMVHQLQQTMQQNLFVVVPFNKVFRQYDQEMPQIEFICFKEPALTFTIVLQQINLQDFVIIQDNDATIITRDQFEYFLFKGIVLTLILTPSESYNPTMILHTMIYCNLLNQQLNAFIVPSSIIIEGMEGFCFLYIENLASGVAYTPNSYLPDPA